MSALAASKMSVPTLLIHTPDGKTRTFALDRDRFTLGRAGNNELCYPDDAGLSRQHLAIEKVGDSWTIRDMGSKNGTFVNGNRIAAPHNLDPNDRITAGHLALEFGNRAPTFDKTVMFIEASPSESTASTFVASLDGVLAKEKELVGTPQMRALIQAGRELAGHMELSKLFELILHLSIDAVGASRGVVMTIEGEDLVVRAAKGEGLRMSTAIRDRVLANKESIVIRDTRLDEALRGRMSIVEQQIRSMIAVPLQTEKRVIGLIYLDSPFFVREFTPEDLSLLTVMANVAAIRIEHARLAEVEQAERMMSHELEQAFDIQRRLLPEQAPDVPGLDLAGYNVPCRGVGGDYYDFIQCIDGRVALLVADVAGKGMPAALLMSNLQARAQVLFDDPADLGALVTRLNRVLKASCPGNRFVTFFIGVIDPATGEMIYVNAGHNQPMIVRGGGQVEQLETTGPILGILPKGEWSEKTCRLEVGDLVALYSDGVTESCPAEVDEEFGEKRLAAALVEMRGNSSKAIIDSVLQRLQTFIAGAPAADDITLVVANRVA
jgi:serine phosphatase RsbU (regulator of sigma subunit)/pSer/pThr/pTyr-binding forkhead associated (FHA) protein